MNDNVDYTKIKNIMLSYKNSFESCRVTSFWMSR